MCGICIAALLVIGSISCCITITAHTILAKMPTAPASTLWIFRQPLFAYNNYAVMAGLTSFPLVAFLMLLCVFFLFEKTHALEISFFSLFIFSLSAETLQLLFPLQMIYPILTVFSAPIARLIFFFRFWACLSLLTASLFAHKTFTRETGAVIFLLSFMSFALAHTIPIDTAGTLSFFSFSESYRSLLYSFNGIIYTLAVLSFLFVGIFRSIPEYRKAALRLLAILIAHATLLYSGSWFFIAISIAGLIIGSFFFLKAIHRFYLWQ